MTLDITDQERDYLLELLEAKRSEMLHELHHTVDEVGAVGEGSVGRDCRTRRAAWQSPT